MWEQIGLGRYSYSSEKRPVGEPQGGTLKSTLVDYFSGSFLRRRLLSGSAWASGGRIGGAMVGIVTNGLVMRMLTTKDERDAYWLALSIVSLGAVVGSLGLPKTAVQLVAENMRLNRSGRTRRVIYTVLGLGVFGTLAASLIYLLVGGLVGNLLHSPALVGVTGLLAGWIAISVVPQ
jgi:O-antigen/teichoic acid export membrane protein